MDVGYLLSGAAVRVTGTSLRNGIQVDYESLIDGLVQQAEKLSELPVLRVHWYDSARDGVPDAQQQSIGELSNVKLRLGRFGMEGQQKGVDLRIGLDLVTHARNGIAEVFILVSGDDDLTEAVEEAQVHGVQVFLLAIPNADDKPHGISRHLIRAADGLKISGNHRPDGDEGRDAVGGPVDGGATARRAVAGRRVPSVVHEHVRRVPGQRSAGPDR